MVKKVYLAPFCRTLRSSIQGVICKIHLFAILFTKSHLAEKNTGKGCMLQIHPFAKVMRNSRGAYIGCIYHIHFFAKVLRNSCRLYLWGCVYRFGYNLVCNQSQNMRWSKSITKHALINYQSSEVCVPHPDFYFLGSHKNKLGKTQCINFWLFIIAFKARN